MRHGIELLRNHHSRTHFIIFKLLVNQRRSLESRQHFRGRTKIRMIIVKARYITDTS